MEEVRGSIPLRSTRIDPLKVLRGVFFEWVAPTLAFEPTISKLSTVRPMTDTFRVSKAVTGSQ
jgi:hypothetical protein